MRSSPPVRTRRRALLLAGVVALALVAGCAPDPPSGVVGLSTSGCGTGTSNGSGMVIEPRLVLTSAHVLRGGRAITVTNGDRATGGEVIAFDPDMDLALVALDGPLGAAIPLGDRNTVAEVADGTTGRAYVMRGGAPISLPVTIRRRVNIRTEDIYVTGETFRPGYEIEAAIQPGDSGGAVVVDGAVIGVIWARSSTAATRAYAIDPIRAAATIETQRRTGELGDVDLTRCI